MRNGQLNKWIYDNNKDIVGVFGSCPNVGISGFILGGGHGMLSAYYGISVHYLKAVDLVFANGTSQYISDETNKDLMWALRGGGHNLGVATRFYFDFSSIPSSRWNLAMYNLRVDKHGLI